MACAPPSSKCHMSQVEAEVLLLWTSQVMINLFLKLQNMLVKKSNYLELHKDDVLRMLLKIILLSGNLVVVLNES